jgi:hypothetical protein
MFMGKERARTQYIHTKTWAGRKLGLVENKTEIDMGIKTSPFYQPNEFINQ